MFPTDTVAIRNYFMYGAPPRETERVSNEEKERNLLLVQLKWESEELSDRFELRLGLTILLNLGYYIL